MRFRVGQRVRVHYATAFPHLVGQETTVVEDLNRYCAHCDSNVVVTALISYRNGQGICGCACSLVPLLDEALPATEVEREVAL